MRSEIRDFAADLVEKKGGAEKALKDMVLKSGKMKESFDELIKKTVKKVRLKSKKAAKKALKKKKISWKKVKHVRKLVRRGMAFEARRHLAATKASTLSPDHLKAAFSGGGFRACRQGGFVEILVFLGFAPPLRDYDTFMKP